MNDRGKSLLLQGLPWHRDARWYMVGLQAVVLVIAGVYILIDTDRARDTILQLIGLVLLVTSLSLGYASLRNVATTLGVFDAFRAGIGATVGVVATASWWTDDIATHAVRIILGWGLIAYCGFHLLGLIAARERDRLRPSVLSTVLLALIVGIILLTGSDAASPNRIRALGVVLLLFGVVFGVLAALLFTRGSHRPSTPFVPR